MNWFQPFFFGILQLFTIWYFLSRPAPESIIIGIPDVENKRMAWAARPKKTWWDDFKEGTPYLVWGFLLGGAAVFLVMV